MDSEPLRSLTAAYRACTQLQRSLMGLHVEFEHEGLPGLSIHILRLLLVPRPPDGRQSGFDTSLLKSLTLKVSSREAALWHEAITMALYQKNGSLLSALSELAKTRLKQ